MHATARSRHTAAAAAASCLVAIITAVSAPQSGVRHINGDIAPPVRPTNQTLHTTIAQRITCCEAGQAPTICQLISAMTSQHGTARDRPAVRRHGQTDRIKRTSRQAASQTNTCQSVNSPLAGSSLCISRKSSMHSDDNPALHLHHYSCADRTPVHRLTDPLPPVPATNKQF